MSQLNGAKAETETASSYCAAEIIKKVTPEPYNLQRTYKRIRGLLGGAWIFDTTEAWLVWEHKQYPQIYIPADSLAKERLKQGKPIQNTAFEISIIGGDLYGPEDQKKTTNQVLIFSNGELKGLVRIEFLSLDQWFEEDQPIYGHAKDPYKRVDVLPSSRHVEIKIDDVYIAETTNAHFLFETGCRPRYYMPKGAVAWQYFKESDTETTCPYKGTAKFYSAIIKGKEYKDIMWWYQHPTLEAMRTEGLVCFYNERCQVYVNRVLERN